MNSDKLILSAPLAGAMKALGEVHPIPALEQTTPLVSSSLGPMARVETYPGQGAIFYVRSMNCGS